MYQRITAFAREALRDVTPDRQHQENQIGEGVRAEQVPNDGIQENVAHAGLMPI